MDSAAKALSAAKKVTDDWASLLEVRPWRPEKFLLAKMEGTSPADARHFATSEALRVITAEQYTENRGIGIDADIETLRRRAAARTAKLTMKMKTYLAIKTPRFRKWDGVRPLASRLADKADFADLVCRHERTSTAVVPFDALLYIMPYLPLAATKKLLRVSPYFLFLIMENARIAPSTTTRSNAPVRVLLAGLDAGGKTTILYKLKLGEVVCTIPTGVVPNQEHIEYKKQKLSLVDVGGQIAMSSYPATLFPKTECVVFVVDSNDRDRMPEARDMLSQMLNHPEMAPDVILLVLANKQDLPKALSVAEICETIGLHSLRDRQWFIQATCATSGDGLYEGLDWLSNALRK